MAGWWSREHSQLRKRDIKLLVLQGELGWLKLRSKMVSAIQTARDSWARKHEALQQRGQFPWGGRAGPSTLQGHPVMGRSGPCQRLQGQEAASTGAAAGAAPERQELISAWSLRCCSQEGVSEALQGSHPGPAGPPCPPWAQPVLQRIPGAFCTLWTAAGSAAPQTSSTGTDQLIAGEPHQWFGMTERKPKRKASLLQQLLLVPGCTPAPPTPPLLLIPAPLGPAASCCHVETLQDTNPHISAMQTLHSSKARAEITSSDKKINVGIWGYCHSPLPWNNTLVTSVYTNTVFSGSRGDQFRERLNTSTQVKSFKWNNMLFMVVCTCYWCSQKRSATERMEMSHQAHGTRVHCSWDALAQWFDKWKKKILS